MDHLDAVLLEDRQPFRGVVARSLDDLDPARDDRRDETGIVRRGHRRQEGQVHPERLIGHLPAAGDLLRQVLGRALGQDGDDAEAAGVGDRRRHLGIAHHVHAALDDRMLDPEELGDARLRGGVLFGAG